MVILCLLAVYTTAQSYMSERIDFSIDKVFQSPQNPQKKQPAQPSATATKPQAVKKEPKGPVKHIQLMYASLVSRVDGVPYQILTDSVEFYHDGAKLFCDSAHFNADENIFEAFSNVRMEQGDTLFLYGNYMQYDGNTKLATVRENVRLENGSATLFTDNLDYDRVNNIGYYFDGGMLVDSNKDGENVLTSFNGQYEPNFKLATFTDSVKLVNPKFILYSDVLKYSTETKIAFITTPTRIVSDSGTIFTSNGRYNTTTENAVLLDQSVVVNTQGNRYLSGDSIVYNKLSGEGQVFGNMMLQDTLKKVILKGHYGFYNDKTEYALSTDSAYCIEYSQGDSLFLAGDTLIMEKYYLLDTLSVSDSVLTIPSLDIANVADSSTTVPIYSDAESAQSSAISISDISTVPPKAAKDTAFHRIKAYYNVRFYRSDLQGVCDSMQFNSSDSILHLYRNPVLWNEGRQLSGDTIDIFMNDSTVDHIHVKRYSFSIEQVDSIRYNQLKGRSLKAYLKDKKINRVFVEGNVESMFYPKDDATNDLIGLNWLESSYLEIQFDEGKIQKMRAWPKVTGHMTPLEIVVPSEAKLKDFYWFDYIRPTDRNDIFRRVSRKASDIPPKRVEMPKRTAEEEEQGY